jgi:hypothetical protein
MCVKYKDFSSIVTYNVPILATGWFSLYLGIFLSICSCIANDFPICVFSLETFKWIRGHFDFVLVHIINGFAILLVSLVFLILSFKTQLLSLRICAIIILAGVIGAIANGILFLMSGQFFGWSIGMTMSAVSVMTVYAISLYFIGENIKKELT